MKRHFTKEKQDDQQGHGNVLHSSLTRKTAIKNTKRRGYIPNTKSNSQKYKKPGSSLGAQGLGFRLSLPRCCSVCDPMDCSTPGLPVLHCLQELAQTQVHLILCHPLLLLPFPASGSFPVSMLFASGGQSIGASASVLPMNIQD